MSTLEDTKVWSSLSRENPNSKYEKCRNITEEIYKRINLTFQIKKLEGGQSDVSEQSDQIDSNDLSNETDLFACDKSDSIPSSTETERPQAPEKLIINNNNNEEMKKKAVVYKRPRKRFRKRVKKRPSKPQSESDGSSDEALPLSRVVELETAAASPDHAGVPNILILTKDFKPKILSPDKKSTKKKTPQKEKQTAKEKLEQSSKEEKDNAVLELPEEKTDEKVGSYMKNCGICNMTFRGEKGLRRHTAISHSINSDEKTRPEREVKPA